MTTDAISILRDWTTDHVGPRSITYIAQMYNQIGYWSQIAGLRDFHEYNVWLDVLNVHVRYQREISARPYRRKIVTFGSISV